MCLRTIIWRTKYIGLCFIICVVVCDTNWIIVIALVSSVIVIVIVILFFITVMRSYEFSYRDIIFKWCNTSYCDFSARDMFISVKVLLYKDVCEFRSTFWAFLYLCHLKGRSIKTRDILKTKFQCKGFYSTSFISFFW